MACPRLIRLAPCQAPRAEDSATRQRAYTPSVADASGARKLIVKNVHHQPPHYDPSRAIHVAMDVRHGSPRTKMYLVWPAQ